MEHPTGLMFDPLSCRGQSRASLPCPPGRRAEAAPVTLAEPRGALVTAPVQRGRQPSGSRTETRPALKGCNPLPAGEGDAHQKRIS